MDLIEIANGEYINVQKYFAFELFSLFEPEEDAFGILANSVDGISLDYESGCALRDYLLSSSKKQQWVYIQNDSDEIILNIEQICKLELDEFECWNVETGEALCLENSQRALSFDEAALRVRPTRNRMKPTSFMKIKAVLNPLEI